MLRFLRNFQLDQISFWLGFLASALLWFLLQRARPALARLRAQLREQAETGRLGTLTVTDIRFKNDMLRQAQKLHLAAPLFALEEILIEPRLLAPSTDPSQPPPISDITEQVLPYLPDWPQLASLYGAPTFSLAQALAGGANLALLGEPGSGKSVALAHLATEIARQSPAAGAFADFAPLLVHVLDLDLAAGQDPRATLIAGLQAYVSKKTAARLPAYVTAMLETGRALLLLDGLDELGPGDREPAIDYLENLLHAYPRTRIVVAAGNQYDGLTRRLGFAPVALASWNYEQRSRFVQSWGTLWTQFIDLPGDKQKAAIDPALINAWLVAESALITPLELCLKTWAAYAGDALGPGERDALEAYVRRLTVAVPKARPALENLALQMLQSRQAAATQAQAALWVQAYEPPGGEPGAGFTPAKEEVFARLDDDGIGAGAANAPRATQANITPRVLPGLLASGVLVPFSGERLKAVHAVVAGYLAAGAQEAPLTNGQPAWILDEICLRYQSAAQSSEQWVQRYLQTGPHDPLQRRLFSAARWLIGASSQAQNATGHAPVLRALAEMLHNRELPLGLRARALAALTASGAPSVATLFRQSLASPDPQLRMLAALGSGALRDTQAVRNLVALLEDPALQVRRAVCLALVSIEDKNALESAAGALLHGDEDLRRAAAEALANNFEEGHPTLEEGATVDDLLVRRAVVYGLWRVRQPWARALLEKMQVEDSQWVVQNAATQALEALDSPEARLPQALPPLTEAPWLIDFASQQGIGVAPGKPARDLALQAMQKGNEDQRLAALAYMSRFGDESAVLPAYRVFFAERGDVQEAALQCLWHLAAGGIPLPPPEQYGL